MFIAKLVSVSTVLSFLLISNFANAENFTIEMLNKLGKEKMVYSEKVISIKVNDEITWKSVDKGHNVEFIGMPKGVSKFKSKISKDAKLIDSHLFIEQDTSSDEEGVEQGQCNQM